MNLFNLLQKAKAVDIDALTCSTPLGNIRFALYFGENEISDKKPQKIELNGETLISSWCLEDCQIEFLRSNFIPKIPATMKVENCIAGIWRIKNHNKKITPVFKTYLENKSIPKIEGEPETGEGIISQYFERDSIKLSIGTEDEEYLARRANAKNWMPRKFASIIDSSNIEYIPNGLKVILPELDEQECVQIQFVVAWSFKTNSSSSTWYAMDQSPEYILNSISRMA